MTAALTVQQAAQEAAVSEKTIRREIADGKLPVTKIRGRLVVLRSDLLAYLQERRQCQSASTARASRLEFSTAAKGLAALLGLGETPPSGSAARGRGSKIVELAERRSSASRKRSSAG